MSTAMFIFSKTPESQDAMWSQLRAAETQRAQYQQAANAAVSRSIGDFHSRVPYADPGVALGVGSAIARGQVDPATAAAAVDQSTAQGNRPAWTAKESAGIVDTLRVGAGLLPTAVANARDLQALEVKSSAQSDKLVRDPTTGAIDQAATLKAAGVGQNPGGAFNWASPTDYLDSATDNLATGVKGVTREGLSVAQSGWEAAQNRGAQGVHAVQDLGSSIASGDVGGAVSAGARALAVASPMPPVETWYNKQVRSELLGAAQATNVGQQVAQYQQLGSVDLGEGFFPGGTVTHTWQPQEARDVRGVIPGTDSAWTYGRGIASLVSQPGTKQYGIMSGLIDGAMQVATDPGIAISDSLLASRGAASLIEAAPKAEQALQTVEGGGEATKVGAYYHGTASPAEVFSPQPLADSGSAYGPGLYTTSSPEQAAGYAANKGGSTVQHLAFEGGKPNVIDMARPAPQSLRDAITSAIDERVMRPSLERALADPDVTGGALYAAFRGSVPSESLFGDLSLDAVDHLKAAGFDALSYPAPEGATHTVFLDPSRLSAAAGPEAVRAASDGVLIDAERPTVSAMRADRLIEHPTFEPYLQKLTDTNDPLVAMKLLGDKAPPSLISAMVNSSDLDTTKAALRDEMGLSYRSTADLPGMQWDYGVKRQVVRHLPGIGDEAGDVAARAFQTVPDRRLEGFRWDSTPLQQRQTMDSIHDALKTVNVPYADRSELMGKFADAFASGTSEDKYNALMAYSDAVNQGMKAMGAPEEFANATSKIWKDTHDTSSLYGVDATGRPSDFGFMATSTGNANLEMISPAKLSEGMSGDVYLPDFRQVRRMTSSLGRVLADTSGDVETWGQKLKFPLSAAQYAAENIFPRLQVTRVATALRIFMDEHAGLAAAGLDTNITHPFQLAAAVLGSSTDLERLGIDARTAQTMLDEAGASLFKADAPEQLLRAARATGRWEDVPFASQQGVQGGLDMARQFSRDPISAMWAQGKSTDEIIDWLHGADPEAGQVAGRSGPDAFQHYVKMGANAVARDAETGARVPAPVNLLDNDTLRGWIEQNIGGQVDAFTKGNTDLRNAIGYNRLPSDGVLTSGGAPITIDPETGAPLGVAFQDGQATPEMQQMMRDWSNHSEAPERVKWNKTVMDRPDANTIKKQWDHASSMLMGGLFDTPLKTLTRSPLYRNEFFDRVAELGSKMSPEAASGFLSDIRANADAQGMVGKVAEWLGGNDRLDNVISSLGQSSGDLTKDDVFQYAHSHALDVVKSALFDHGRMTNIEQTLRSMVPFVGAWRQVLGRWVRLISQNPGIVRRFQTIVQGARGAGFFFTDPVSGEERFNFPGSDWLAHTLTGGGLATAATAVASQTLGGVASHLPVVGPAIQQGVSDVVNPVIKALPVVGAGLGGVGPGVGGMSLGGNVKDLSIISGSFLPGFGPLIQMPAAHILGNVPQADFIRGLLMPYGVPTDENSPLGEPGAYLLPGWAQKISSAITSDPDSASSFGNTYLQVVQNLASSGKYGTGMDDRRQMLDDAKNYARVLTVLRGLGQFVSPASPSYDPKVATSAQSDVLMSKLAADFHTMESQDYDTAVQKFLDTYGEGPFIAAISKTKSVKGGLDASTEFGNWERDHGGTIGSYPDVAGYFAPVGSDFDFEVYNRQLASGERKKLTGDELVNAAQATLAEWKYRQAQAMLGDHPNVAQLNWLTDVKAQLQKQYPGYGVAPGNATDFSVKIQQLTKASTDPGLKGDVQTALATYLWFRNQALASAQQRAGGKESAGITSDKNADLRAWLAGAANKIVAKYPDFARMYDNVLSNEVNQ